MRLATEKEKFQYLGAPGDLKNLTMVRVPSRLKLSWKLEYTVNRIQCHKLVARQVELIYIDLFKLAPETIAASGVDIFGGCYNFRAVRGTEKKARPPFSTHAWGAAIDIDPERNGLFTKTVNANMTRYPEVISIFKKYGFVNIGNFISRDWMHFEASFELISNSSAFL
jgi:hypothetical protein